MKVLFVGNAYYPNIGYGGPVRVMRTFALGLTELGHEVTVFCSNIIDRTDFNKISSKTIEQNRENIRVVYLDTFLRLSDGLTISFDLVRYLKRELPEYDVVHLFGFRNYFIDITALYARRFNVPYIIHPVGTVAYHNSKPLVKTLWDAVFKQARLTHARFFIQPSEEQIDILLKNGVPQKKIKIVPWSPDPSLRKHRVDRIAYRAKLGISEEDKVILHLGRVHRKKGIKYVLQALTLLDLDSNVKFVIVGHDDDGSAMELRRMASELNVADQVLWIGPVHAPESAQFYNLADVFALVTENDSAPVALLETLSMGVPVIISNSTGLTEFIRDRAGLVVDKSPEAVAEGLQILFSDIELQKKFGEQAKRIVDEYFSQKSSAQQLQNLYVQLNNST